MNNNKLLQANQDPRNPSYHFKNLTNEDVKNTDVFNSFIKSNILKTIYTGTLWAEEPLLYLT